MQQQAWPWQRQNKWQVKDTKISQANKPTNQPTKMNKQSSHQRKSSAKSQQGRTPRDALRVPTPKDSQGRD
jgi:hypothetical protein